MEWGKKHLLSWGLMERACPREMLAQNEAIARYDLHPITKSVPPQVAQLASSSATRKCVKWHESGLQRLSARLASMEDNSFSLTLPYVT